MDIEDSSNFRRIGDKLTTSGLVHPDVLGTLAAQGYEVVVNLLPDSNEKAVRNERDIVESQGIEYVHIPVNFQQPTRLDFVQFCAALDKTQGKKTHVHCAANYRVSAFYSLYQVRRRRWTVQQAQDFISGIWKPAEYSGWTEFIAEMLGDDLDQATAAIEASESGMYEDVLTFWFEEISPESWWSTDPALDETIRVRYAALLQRAKHGELFQWRSTPEGRLAEIIVLDQFSRNIYRNRREAFAQDPIALVLAQEAVAAHAHERLSPIRRTFMLMPYMHSESRLVHVEADALFREFAPDNHDFELRHKAIVDRFGRYPHRNEVLGRVSTPEEIAFLREPGSSF